jgi:pentatricopeptide repeat protein
VFNYFAGEIFEQLSADTREFLIRTCLLPRVTADLANALTGRSDGASVLAKLHKRQLFIDRRLGETLTYQYHALFRLFLQTQAKECRTQAEWNALVVASAEPLATYGQVEEAVPLFIAGQAWEPAVRLIVTHAQALLALGRWQTVQQWIESLPEPLRNTTPWLRFWLGMCRLRVDPAKARLDLEPAFALFQQEDDTLGQALAATAINEAHMVECVDFRRLGPWIASLETLMSPRDVALPSLDTELAVRASLFTAIVLRQTYREDIPHLARQLADLLRHDLDSDYKLLAARGLFVYAAYSGDFVLTDEVVHSTESAFYAPGASALNRAWYAARLGFALRYVKGARKKARAWFAKAREIVREHGLRFVEAPIALYWTWAEEVFGESADIERELKIAEAHFNPASRFEVAFRRTVMAFLCARQNDLSTTEAHIREILSERSGYLLGGVGGCLSLTAMRLQANDFSGAGDALDQALRLLFPGPLRSYSEGMLSAGIALGVKDEERAKTGLRLALALGAKHGLENTLSEHLFRPTTAALCAYALQHGIEPGYVKRIIHAQHLAAPSPEIEDWPWPVWIRALGGFSLEIEDRLVSFSGKAPKKPLELLKALVARGGTNVDIAWLGEQLWPDAEGEAARAVFNVTHSRLRKLLPMEGVLLLSAGKLSLSPAHVWTDVWAFERVAEDCLEKLRRRAESLEIESLGETLLSLYSGDLLKGEPDAPWLIAARDRLRSKFLRTLKALGGFWEANEVWDKAQSLYERVLEIDNVAEEVYRRLMGCYARAGRPAEALRVYRRCRQMLSVVLGIAPSAETETLCRSIAQAQ